MTKNGLEFDRKILRATNLKVGTIFIIFFIILTFGHIHMDKFVVVVKCIIISVKFTMLLDGTFFDVCRCKLKKPRKAFHYCSSLSIFRSCSPFLAIFIRSSWFGQVNNPLHGMKRKYKIKNLGQGSIHRLVHYSDLFVQ